MSNYFELVNRDPRVPILAHIPHSSIVIPAQERSAFLLSEDLLQKEILRMTDWFTDELFQHAAEIGAFVVRYGVSRLVLDPERYEDDDEEIMSHRGMGVLYTHTHDGRLLRSPIAGGERERMLATYYRPYHRALASGVAHIINRFGRCLLIDCHSFPSAALPYELNKTGVRPDFCFGTHELHTPKSFLSGMVEAAREGGYSTACDTPFAGTYVPPALHGDERLISLMVEVNRSLYMNEENGTKSSRFTSTKDLVDRLIERAVFLLGR